MNTTMSYLQYLFNFFFLLFLFFYFFIFFAFCICYNIINEFAREKDLKSIFFVALQTFDVIRLPVCFLQGKSSTSIQL